VSNSPPATLDSSRAWVVVCAGFIACFVAFGVLYAFGVFLKPMSTEFGVTHAVMSALFSCMSLLSYVLGPFTGKLTDRIGPRRVVFTGAAVTAAALLITPHARSFAMAFLTLGIGIGAGIACSFVPAMATVGEWFKKSRDLALGVAISGIGVGTLASAPLAAALIRDYGWRHTMTLYGFGAGALLLISAALMATPPIKVGSKGSSRELWAKVGSLRFSLLYLSLVLVGISIFIPMVYLPALAQSEGVQRVAAAALVGYVGGASVVSRIGLDLLAEKIGLMKVFQLSFAIICGACAAWMYLHGHTGLAEFAVLLGIGYGGVAALTPAVAAHMFGLEDFGELLGLLLTAFGLASVLGPPFAGYLVDRSGNYRDIVWYALATAVLGLVSIIALSRRSVVGSDAEKSEQAAA
jgi:MFS family permease